MNAIISVGNFMSGFVLHNKCAHFYDHQKNFLIKQINKINFLITVYK